MVASRACAHDLLYYTDAETSGQRRILFFCGGGGGGGGGGNRTRTYSLVSFGSRFDQVFLHVRQQTILGDRFFGLTEAGSASENG